MTKTFLCLLLFLPSFVCEGLLTCEYDEPMIKPLMQLAADVHGSKDSQWMGCWCTLNAAGVSATF